MQEIKPWYASKVVLGNIFMAVAMVLCQFPAFAGVGEFINTHFAEFGMGWGMLNIFLRLFKSNIVF